MSEAHLQESAPPAVPAEVQGDLYLAWNDAIARRFFHPEMAGRRVLLYVNEEVVAQVAAELGSTRTEFLEIVKAGPSWSTSAGVCQSALDALRDWRDRALPYPPYVAYLGAFVLAAGLEGDFESWAYHPRLRVLLEMPGQGEIPSFNRMYELWQDLELWSVGDIEGSLGIFEVTFAGEWIHVGLPKAQALLTESERRYLPRIFAEADLEPGSTAVPAAHLAAALRRFGSGRLTPRTLGRLARPSQDQVLYDLFLETVAEELLAWDGGIPAANPDEAARVVHAVLRLGLRVDRFSGRVQSVVRVRSGRPLPDGGLSLEVHGQRLTALEEAPGWSSALTYDDGRVCDGAELNWNDGTEFADPGLQWTVRMPALHARIFVSGDRFGLPDFIEAERLPLDEPFYLAVSDDQAARLEPWLHESCDDVQTVRVLEGLRESWTLQRIGRAHEGMQDVRFPALAAGGGATRLRLLGGVRSAKGRNEFFSHAPPLIATDGAATGGPVPTYAEHPLSSVGPGVFGLPPDLPRDERIEIRLEADQGHTKRLSFYLTSDFLWQRREPTAVADRWGRPVEPGNGRIAGAVAGADTESSWGLFPLLAASGWLGTDATFNLLGRRPGQVTKWPDPGVPEDWDPVWLISSGRRPVAIFAGTDLDAAKPEPSSYGDRRAVDSWKELTWRGRRRIKPPAEPQLARLWREYVELGKRV